MYSNLVTLQPLEDNLPPPIETTSKDGWTFKTLLSHLLAVIDANDRRYEQRFISSQLAVDAALNAAKEAVLKAEMAADKRFDAVNEFRGQLSDQQKAEIGRTNDLKSLMMPRKEAELQLDGLRYELKEMKERTTALFTINAKQGGVRAGANATYGYIIGAIGAVIGIVSLVVLLRK